MKRYLFPAIVLLLTATSLSPVLKNGFTTWDDPQYILENPLIRELSVRSVATIFTTPEFAGNYHPLTLLLHALEYTLFGTGPSGYHLVSLLLHLVTTLLLYLVVRDLSGSDAPAFIAALLFGIHPMHVEPVAWAADQKDLLYAVFFAGALYVYLRYRESGRRSLLYAGVLPLFLASLLSKGLAVTLPVILLLIDDFRGRNIDGAAVREKIPLFVLSIIFGVAAILAQSSAGAVTGPAASGLAERIITASTGYMIYLEKLIVPFSLSPYYPYPDAIPAWHWLFVAASAGIVVLGFSMRKREPVVFFGLAAFTLMIAPVLQILPVGNAMMADRYVYLPSIGIFLVGATFIAGRPVMRKPLPVVAVGLYALALAWTTFSLAPVWNDGVTLWSRVIDEYPGHAKGYFNRGYALQIQGRSGAAIRDYDQALAIDPGYPYGHFNRGVSKASLGMTEEALADFNRELKDRKNDPGIYYRRGLLFASEAGHMKAIADFDTALALDSGYTDALTARGLSRTAAGDLEGALRDFEHALRGRPTDPDLRFNHANILAGLGRYSEAVTEYSTVIGLSPGDADAWFRRGFTKHLSGDRTGACADFNRASQLGSSEAAAAISEYCR